MSLDLYGGYKYSDKFEFIDGIPFPTSSPATTAARSAFFSAIHQECHDVLDELAMQVLPYYEVIARFEKHQQENPAITQDNFKGLAQEFELKLVKWVKKYNLFTLPGDVQFSYRHSDQPYDRYRRISVLLKHSAPNATVCSHPSLWVFETILETLHAWTHNLEVRENRQIKPYIANWTSALPSEDMVFKYSTAGWDPLTETRAQAEQRIRKSFLVKLKDYLDLLEEGLGETHKYKKTKEIRRKEHFSWLALYQIKEMSPGEIIKHYSKRYTIGEESTVYLAVKKTAELIELPLRNPKQGRKKL